MYQPIPSQTIPLGNFFDGRIPTPEQKRVQNPHPRAYKNELKPTSGAFSSVIHNKNMKKMRQKSCKMYNLSSLDD